MNAPGHPEEQGPLAGLAPPPMRVLVLGRDRQFKRMARLLFERRGSAVLTGSDAAHAVELVDRHDAGVVVLDASDSLTAALRAAGSIAALAHPVGFVLVSADPERAASRVRVLPKWGPFDDLFSEVARVHRLSRTENWSRDAVL